MNNENNIVIILTSTVFIKSNIDCMYQCSSLERIKIYINSVVEWLNNTNFKIILVENSGYNFEELQKYLEKYNYRFEIITYIEENEDSGKYLKWLNSKGSSEVFAINYAFNNSKLITENSFIIKITGRYYIDGLEEYLNNYDCSQYDCLRQNDINRCEMIGSHYKNFNKIFELIFDNTLAEIIWKTRISKFKNIIICKKFIIKNTQRGGVNECYDNI